MVYEVTFRGRDPAYVVYKRLKREYLRRPNPDLNAIQIQGSTIIIDETLLSTLERIVKSSTFTSPRDRHHEVKRVLA